MKNTFLYINSVLSKLDNWKYLPFLLIILGIISKWLHFLIIHFLYGNNSPHLYNHFVGDDKFYMDFCENFFSKGTYFVKTFQGYDYTFRMPAFNLLYYPFRLFLNKEYTMDAIIIFQTTLSGIVCFYLANISKILFQSKKVFYLVFFISCFGFLNAFNNHLLMRESLAFSSIILSIYLLLKGLGNQNGIYFIFSGFFMTWLIFLRPYTIVLYALLFCVLVLYIYKKKITLKNFILFNLIFTILISMWTIRNYTFTHRFIPLESSVSWVNNSKPLKAKINFIKDFGFHWEAWRLDSQSGWLNDTEAKTDFETIHRIFPERTFNGDLTSDSLIKLKYHYNLFENSLNIDEKLIHENQSLRLFNKFSFELKNDRPFDYYFLNRIRILKSFLGTNTFSQLSRLKYPFNVLCVFSETFYNYVLKIIGIFGLFLIIFHYKKNYLLLSCTVFFPLFILFFFPIYGGADEGRFFFLATPFLIISTCYSLLYLFKKNIYKLTVLCVFLVIPIILAIQKVTELINF